MSSLIFRTANHFIVPITLLFAGYMALKGHNLPGGGFIGGLIASVAIVLYRMSNGSEAMSRIMPIHPRLIVAAGLVIAVITSIVPLFFDQPLLTSTVFDIPLPYTPEPLHVPTAFFFDLGVLFVVIGVAVGMIVRLAEEVEDE